jgi:hypothetical protein
MSVSTLKLVSLRFIQNYADMAYICIKYDGLIMAGFEDGCFW